MAMSKTEHRLTRLGLCIVALSWMPIVAQAQEPRHKTEPAVLSESSIDLLQIPEAFVEGDPFDLNLRLSFRHDSRRAKIYRQSSSSASRTGFEKKGLVVGTSGTSTQRLTPEIQIGVMQNLALKLRLPVILADNRKLEANQAEDSGATLSPDGET